MTPGLISAYAYIFLIGGVVLFQFCLLAGAPWGRLTQGGQHEGALPVSGRVAAAISVPILVFLALSISSAAGLAPHWPRWATYVAVVLQAVVTALNWITPSRSERLLWGPVTTIMLLLALYVVFTGV